MPEAINKPENKKERKSSNWLLTYLSFALVLAGVTYSQTKCWTQSEESMIMLFAFLLVVVWLIYYYIQFKLVHTILLKLSKIVALLLVSLFLMGQFQAFCGPHLTVTAVGFSKLRPQLAGTSFTHDGSFTGIFTNVIGASIKIIEIKIEDKTVDGKRGVCFSNDIEVSSGKTEGVVATGDNFQVKASGCGSGQVDGFYEKTVQIRYILLSTNQSLLDTGTIRGPYK